MLYKIKKVQKYLARKNLDAVLISDLANIRYLCGFTGSSSFLLITRHSPYLLTDFRYMEQAEAETSACEIIIAKKSYVKEIIQLCNRLHVEKLAFEELDLIYARALELGKSLKLHPVKNIVERMRAVKTPEEIDNIRKACEITVKTMDFIMHELIIPGAKEREIAAEAEYFMKKNGADGVAFGSIIASGHNSAMPHASVSNRIIERDDFVICDIGARYNGYCADMTRTFCAGKATAFQKKIYEIVRKAQWAVLGGRIEQKSGSEIDFVARSIVNAAGYKKSFGHGLGHGVGLKAHEQPTVSSRSNIKIKPGMVFTIEPGIYLKGRFGVRIEDTVALEKNNKVVPLTEFTRKLIEI